MNLQKLGEKHKTDKATFHKYCDFYERHLPGPGFEGRLLEIGVYEGASLKMWREYYPKAQIIGIDIIDKSHLDIEGVTILKMDATDLVMLRELGFFDIIIDDGSHDTKDQQISFLWLYHHQLSKFGFYVMEDLHTSFSPDHITSNIPTADFLEASDLLIQYYQRDESDNDSMTAIIRGGQTL